MKLSELFGRAGLAFPPDAGEIDLCGIETHSDRVTPGCLFLCIKGLRSDGHEFVTEALERGAAVVVAEKVHGACAGGAATVLVEDTRRAASLLYHAWYGNPAEHMKLVGVTGTNGKTSVAWMLASILEEAGIPCGLIGTVGCRSVGRALYASPYEKTANMTTPDPSELFRLLDEMRRDGVEIVVMEVTSHALALRKVEGLSFELAIFTNLTPDHLDFHADMEDYFAQKAKLFERARNALICVDDTYGRRLFQKRKDSSFACSLDSKEHHITAYASEIVFDGTRGCRYLWHFGREEHRVSLPLAGNFAVINSLEAATAARMLGVPAKGVLCALHGMKQVPGRMESVPLGECADFRVLIDYAHTPDALEKLLRSVSELIEEQGRILLLFGCGGDRDRSKRREMAHIASRFADFVILTSDNSRTEDPSAILADIERGMDKEKPYTVIEDRKEAIAFGLSLCRRNDILVLAGKGHETYEINKTGRHPFDEKQIVREILSKRGIG